jgi:transposase
MKPLSADRQNSILSRLQRGHSISQVARDLGLSISTVSKYKSIHLPGLPTSKGGRTSKLSDRDRSHIRRNMLTGTWKTAAEAHAGLLQVDREPLSQKTVRRALHKMGFQAKIKLKKPFLSAKHKKARLAWALAHKHWTTDDWRRVIFTDETKINVWGSGGCRYCWTRPGDQLRDHHLDLTVKHGNGSLMMWGCMTHAGIGYGCQIDEGS